MGKKQVHFNEFRFRKFRKLKLDYMHVMGKTVLSDSAYIMYCIQVIDKGVQEMAKQKRLREEKINNMLFPRSPLEDELAELAVDIIDEIDP